MVSVASPNFYSQWELEDVLVWVIETLKLPQYK